LLKLLANTKQPLNVYIFKVYALAISIGLSVAVLIDFAFPNAESPDFEIGIGFFIEAVLLGPIIETLLMIPIIYLIRKMTSNILYISLISALIWGGLHSLQVPLWGVGVFALFFFLSMAYQYWDSHSRKHALFVVTVIHALNNATVVIISALES
tara:strand:+ start:576 stop:1037 length:462 start_codon:yes stop_codon:yes gene_type:complete